jgi:site-specific recombinase XerD
MFISKSKKSPFYQLTYIIDGKRTTISTKTSSKKDAQQFLYNFQKEKSAGTTCNSTPQKTCITVDSFRTEYLEYCRPIKSSKYTESIDSAFKQFIRVNNDSALDEVSTRTVDKFITITFARTQRGAHQYYRTLKASFNKAVEWNYIDSNPFSKVKFPKLSRSFPVFVAEDELLIIIANTPYQYLKDIFIVAFYTGLRLGELINMKWDWLNFEQNCITVRCTEGFQTKSKKERIVPMSNKVRSVLINRFNNSNHILNDVVFYRKEKRRLHQDTISKQFKIIVRKSNLNEKIHFHSLRHSFASVLVQKGVSLYIIKELLGHQDLATTQIYSHLQQQNLRDAVNML